MAEEKETTAQKLKRLIEESAAKDIEISRLNAELGSVKGERDKYELEHGRMADIASEALTKANLSKGQFLLDGQLYEIECVDTVKDLGVRLAMRYVDENATAFVVKKV